MRTKTQRRETYSSGTPWEPKVGYSRMVQVGNQLWISGTTATAADGQIVGVDDAYLQTKQALKNIGAALERAGATFADIRPATAMVEVRALIDSRMLVEIEADALITTK